MLNILEGCLPFHGYNLAALGTDNPQFFHFMIEAKKIAYSVLHRYDADPKFAPVPLDILLSKQHAAAQCSKINPNAARPAEVSGNIGEGTIYMASADRWGNMVSLVYGNFSGLTITISLSAVASVWLPGLP